MNPPLPAPPNWGPHWEFVLTGYGLVLLALAWLLASSLLRLHRAKERLALMQKLGRNSAGHGNLSARRKKD